MALEVRGNHQISLVIIDISHFPFHNILRHYVDQEEKAQIQAKIKA